MKLTKNMEEVDMVYRRCTGNYGPASPLQVKRIACVSQPHSAGCCNAAISL